ncbi:MAG: cyclic nucleotide-binding domain-containing protein [Treponema sp.]|nr:cyclic nucleotide-binding domain-containing protein [Treponema sp.]
MLQLSFVNYKKGAALVVEGKAQSDRFFIIQVGQVQCVSEVKIPGQEQTILGPGDFVGVIPCMSNHLQIETVIAMTDVTVIAVMRDQYPELIAKNTPVAMKIIRTFANKMRVLNGVLTKLTLNNVASESPEQLFNVASYYDKANRPDVAIYAYYQYLKACPNGGNAETAKQRFVTLKPRSRAVYVEPTEEMTRKYPKGTMIFCENQSGADMFIIQSGEVSISKVVDGNEVTLAVLRKGDMFGEMALLENKPRSASAIAHEECVLMVVNRKNFDLMVATQAQLIARLTTTLAERLWAQHRQLTNSQIKEYSHKLVDMLALQLEKAKLNITSTQGFQTNLSVQDLVTMCGIPTSHQAQAINDFTNLVQPKIVGGKLYVSKPSEIIKSAAFYRSKA